MGYAPEPQHVSERGTQFTTGHPGKRETENFPNAASLLASWQTRDTDQGRGNSFSRPTYLLIACDPMVDYYSDINSWKEIASVMVQHVQDVGKDHRPTKLCIHPRAFPYLGSCLMCRGFLGRFSSFLGSMRSYGLTTSLLRCSWKSTYARRIAAIVNRLIFCSTSASFSHGVTASRASISIPMNDGSSLDYIMA